jgi:hypothetical protein
VPIPSFKCKCSELSGPLSHIIELSTYNAAWHRSKYKETGDRYHLGQWKAYSRTAKRLKSNEQANKKDA